MMEGAFKYGRHNYRPAGVLCSIYTDAAIDHIVRFWEGQDIDPDTWTIRNGNTYGLTHITKAICALIVLRDSMIKGNWVDDRPVRSFEDGGETHRAEMQAIVDGLFDKYPNPKEPFTHLDLGGYNGA